MAWGNLNPAYLPAGTRVGPWLVLEHRGRGAHGTVYSAVSIGTGEPRPAALKLAATPDDPRFQREVELLALLHHPGIPRLLGHGTWVSPEGRPHPYLAMDLVDGASLYSWARLVSSTPRRVLRVLAALARALEAVHAAGGVHRDVKGTNVLVRSSDEHVFLTDFGSSTHQGASRLTWRAHPPGTSAYRAPEAWRFATTVHPSGDDHYAAGPADDVFALGVTAYRLVSERYPPTCDPRDEDSRCWSDKTTGPRPQPPVSHRAQPPHLPDALHPARRARQRPGTGRCPGTGGPGAGTRGGCAAPPLETASRPAPCASAVLASLARDSGPGLRAWRWSRLALADRVRQQILGGIDERPSDQGRLRHGGGRRRRDDRSRVHLGPSLRLDDARHGHAHDALPRAASSGLQRPLSPTLPGRPAWGLLAQARCPAEGL